MKETRVVVVRVFRKKTQIEIALERQGRSRAERDAMEEEFAVASALIDTRTKAHMIREEVAKAMGTTQAVIARLEGG